MSDNHPVEAYSLRTRGQHGMLRRPLHNSMHRSMFGTNGMLQEVLQVPLRPMSAIEPRKSNTPAKSRSAHVWKILALPAFLLVTLFQRPRLFNDHMQCSMSPTVFTPQMQQTMLGPLSPLPRAMQLAMRSSNLPCSMWCPL